MKILTLYYSYGGNTKRIAERVQKTVGGDIACIETMTPYEGDYNSVVDQGQREVNRGFCPKIKPLAVNVQDYDVIVLGTPVWWYTFAPAVHTFLTQQDLSGKTVYPFATNGGWIGHTFADIEKSCKGAEVREGMNIRFDEDVLRTSETEIDAWIQKIAK